MKLKEATASSGSVLTPIEWLQENKKSSQLCLWDMVINLQIDMMLYVRVICHFNFDLYVYFS